MVGAPLSLASVVVGASCHVSASSALCSSLMTTDELRISSRRGGRSSHCSMGAALQRSGEGKGGGGGEGGGREGGGRMSLVLGYWAAVACARPVAWSRASSQEHDQHALTSVRMSILVSEK